MHRRRVIVSMLALVLGLAAGAIAYTYLSSVQRRAYQGAQLTSVYITTGTIAQGTTASQAEASGLIKQTKIPMQFRPSTAVQSVSEIGGDIAIETIAQNQVLVSGQFATVSPSGGPAAQQIPKGDVAISVSVDAVHGVAGLVTPGDRVDLLVQLTAGQKEVVLYQDVPVLAVGSLVAQSSGGSSALSSTAGTNGGIVTFAVPLDAAERIAMVEGGSGSTAGSLYLALVAPGSGAAAQPEIGGSALLPASPLAS